MGSAPQLNGFIDVWSKGRGQARKVCVHFQNRKEAATGSLLLRPGVPSRSTGGAWGRAVLCRGTFTLRAGSGLLAPTQETAVAPRPCDQQNCLQTFPRAPWG